MRFMSTLVLAFFATMMVVASPTAFAKDEYKGIQTLGIQSVDDVFKQVEVISDKVSDARDRRQTGRTAIITALDLPKGTPLEDALADLKSKAAGNLKVVVEGGRPTLQASDAIPANVQAAIDAVNTATESYTEAIKLIADVPQECKNLQPVIQELPAKFKAEMGGFKLSDFKEIRTQAKKFKHNLEFTAGLPDRTTKLAKNLAEDLELVSSTFK